MTKLIIGLALAGLLGAGCRAQISDAELFSLNEKCRQELEEYLSKRKRLDTEAIYSPHHSIYDKKRKVCLAEYDAFFLDRIDGKWTYHFVIVNTSDVSTQEIADYYDPGGAKNSEEEQDAKERETDYYKIRKEIFGIDESVY